MHTHTRDLFTSHVSRARLCVNGCICAIRLDVKETTAAETLGQHTFDRPRHTILVTTCIYEKSVDACVCIRLYLASNR